MASQYRPSGPCPFGTRAATKREYFTQAAGYAGHSLIVTWLLVHQNRWGRGSAILSYKSGVGNRRGIPGHFSSSPCPQQPLTFSLSMPCEFSPTRRDCLILISIDSLFDMDGTLVCPSFNKFSYPFSWLTDQLNCGHRRRMGELRRYLPWFERARNPSS